MLVRPRNPTDKNDSFRLRRDLIGRRSFFSPPSLLACNNQQQKHPTTCQIIIILSHHLSLAMDDIWDDAADERHQSNHFTQALLKKHEKVRGIQQWHVMCVFARMPRVMLSVCKR